MKKLQIIGYLFLLLTMVGFLLWRCFMVPFPDWLIRVNGVLMMAAIFVTVFSGVKIGRKNGLKFLK